MRVIGIVLTHLKSAKYEFSVAERTPSATVDIALVDDSDPEMRKRLATVLASNPALPVVHLVAETGQAGAQCELLSSQLMMQLLPTLERLLHSLANQPPAAPVAAASTSTVTTLPPTRNRL
ncbi:MAG: hypothetical protein Q7V20_12555, partial [Aquabacterium sp.]